MMRTIRDEYMTLAGQKVSDSAEVRIHFGDLAADELLREAAKIYTSIGEDEEARLCLSKISGAGEANE